MARALLFARITLREAVRKKMILAVLLLSAVFAGMYAFGFYKFHESFISRPLTRGNNPLGYEAAAGIMVIMGFYVVNFLAGVMAIFASVGSISSEIETSTFHAVVPKPLHRWEIVLGKWLGFAVMLALYVALMTGAVVLSAWSIGRYLPPNLFGAVLLVILVSLLLMSMTILGSTILSTITNGIVIFMLYGIGLTGGLVEQIGTLLNNEVLKTIAIIASLAVPSDIIYKKAADIMWPASAPNVPTPFTPAVPPSDAMVLYAVIYMLLALGGAMLVFRRRDL
jgi:ABC-type transport system involved in multi-copper enzyme maturation permease subunit